MMMLNVMVIISFVIEQIRKSSFGRANAAHWLTRDLERYKEITKTFCTTVVMAVLVYALMGLLAPTVTLASYIATHMENFVLDMGRSWEHIGN